MFTEGEKSICFPDVSLEMVNLEKYRLAIKAKAAGSIPAAFVILRMLKIYFFKILNSVRRFSW